MDVKKTTADEFRGQESERLRETELNLRKELLDIDMDIYQSPSSHLGKIRTLRRNLARLMTVKTEKLREAAKQAKEVK